MKLLVCLIMEIPKARNFNLGELFLGIDPQPRDLLQLPSPISSEVGIPILGARVFPADSLEEITGFPYRICPWKEGENTFYVFLDFSDLLEHR